MLLTETVLLFTVTVLPVSLKMPPPMMPDSLLEMVMFVTVSVPALKMPPPLDAHLPSKIFNLAMVAFTPLFTSKTRTFLLPSTASSLSPGPLIVKLCVISSVLVSRISGAAAATERGAEHNRPARAHIDQRLAQRAGAVVGFAGDSEDVVTRRSFRVHSPIRQGGSACRSGERKKAKMANTTAGIKLAVTVRRVHRFVMGRQFPESRDWTAG